MLNRMLNKQKVIISSINYRHDEMRKVSPQDFDKWREILPVLRDVWSVWDILVKEMKKSIDKMLKGRKGRKSKDELIKINELIENHEKIQELQRREKEYITGRLAGLTKMVDFQQPPAKEANGSSSTIHPEEANGQPGMLPRSATTLTCQLHLASKQKDPKEEKQHMKRRKLLTTKVRPQKQKTCHNMKDRKSGNTCHQCKKNNRTTVVACTKCQQKSYCIQCINEWYPQLQEEDIANLCPFCRGNCNCNECLQSRIKVKKMALYAVEAAVKDLENFMPLNSQHLEDFPHYPSPQYDESSDCISNHDKVPVIEDQTLQNSDKGATAEVGLQIDGESLQTSQNIENGPTGKVGSQINHENVKTSQSVEDHAGGEMRLEMDRETTPSHFKHEVGKEDNTESLRNSEEGGHSVRSNLEVPNSRVSTIPPSSRDTYKMNGQSKDVSQPSLYPHDFVAELRAMRVTRDNEVEVMRKRLELEQKREERKTKKMHHMQLNTLLTKEHLSPEEEDIKRHLFVILYGK